MNFLLNTLLFLSSSFLILLVLVQRGRGGGLAGALGGMGGQSAFGTKAGDVFTKVTIIVAAVWILLCAGSVVHFRPLPEDKLFKTDESIGSSQTPGGNAAGEGAAGTPPPESTGDEPPAPTGTAPDPGSGP